MLRRAQLAQMPSQQHPQEIAEAAHAGVGARPPVVFETRGKKGLGRILGGISWQAGAEEGEDRRAIGAHPFGKRVATRG